MGCAHGLLERATFAASDPAAQWLKAGYFPSAAEAAFTSRGKITGLAAILRWRFGPSLRSGAGPSRMPPFVAMKAAMGAADPTKEAAMTTDPTDGKYEPLHTSSQTDHVLAELQLYGYRPFQDDPDPRPLPEAQTIVSAVAAIFDALAGALNDTRL